jgi:hypothetical protein
MANERNLRRGTPRNQETLIHDDAGVDFSDKEHRRRILKKMFYEGVHLHRTNNGRGAPVWRLILDRYPSRLVACGTPMCINLQRGDTLS